jgi:hypothetical protein
MSPHYVYHYVRGTRRSPTLPGGYRLDLASDPDAPALRRSDGTVVARFGARGMTEEAIEREAWEDLLHRSEESRQDQNPVARPQPT